MKLPDYKRSKAMYSWADLLAALSIFGVGYVVLFFGTVFGN